MIAYIHNFKEILLVCTFKHILQLSFTQQSHNAVQENKVKNVLCPLPGVLCFSFKDTGHLCLLSKNSLLTWCISTYLQNNKPVKILGNWSSKLRDINGRKNTLVIRSCVLLDA